MFKPYIHEKSVFPRCFYHWQRLYFGHIYIVVAQHVQHGGETSALVVYLEF